MFDKIRGVIGDDLVVVLLALGGLPNRFLIALDQTAIVKLFILYAAVARAVGKAFACAGKAHTT